MFRNLKKFSVILILYHFVAVVANLIIFIATILTEIGLKFTGVQSSFGPH